MTGPDREGRGAARAMLAALADAGRRADDVGYVSAHGTATPFNDLMEAKALALVLGARAASTPVNSIKSALGHTLGAAAALEALACVRTLETGLVAADAGLDDARSRDRARRRPRTARAPPARGRPLDGVGLRRHQRRRRPQRRVIFARAVTARRVRLVDHHRRAAAKAVDEAERERVRLHDRVIDRHGLRQRVNGGNGGMNCAAPSAR